jgi:hypothetical protein
MTVAGCFKCQQGHRTNGANRQNRENDPSSGGGETGRIPRDFPIGSAVIHAHDQLYMLQHRGDTSEQRDKREQFQGEKQDLHAGARGMITNGITPPAESITGAPARQTLSSAYWEAGHSDGGQSGIGK